MADQVPPLIKIGNIELEEGLISWRLQAGVGAFATTIQLTKDRANAVWSQGFPTTLTMTVERSDGATVKKETKTFSNVWVVERDDSDPFFTTLVLKDMRWRWEGKRHTRRYNVKRVLNDAEIVESGGIIQQPGSSPFSDYSMPGVLDVRQNYLQIPKFRYFSWSLNPDTGEPWTALEIAEDVLNRTLENGTGKFGGRKHGLADNRWQPDEEAVLGEDGPAVLARALQFARANIAVWPDGKVYLYPYDIPSPLGYLPPDGIYTIHSQRIYQRHMERIRPRKIVVEFEKEREVWFQYNSDWEAADNTTVLAEDYPLLVPVLQLPQNEEFPAFTWPNGESEEAREWPAGAWIWQEIAFDKWDLPIDDGVGLGVDIRSMIRYHLFTGAYQDLYFMAWNLAEYGSVDRQTITTESTPHLRMAAIKAHWRRTYMISNWYVSRWVRLRAERVGVINNINLSGQRIPSPAFLDWLVILNTRPGKHVLDAGIDQGGMNMTSFEDSDGNARDVLQPAPFQVGLVNPKLGIIQIQALPDKSQAINRSEPYQMEDDELALTVLFPGAEAIIGGAGEGSAISADHRFETILSIVLATENGIEGNSEKQWHREEVKYDGTDAHHDYYNYLSRRDTARFTTERNNEGTTFLNEEMVKLLASNEARRIWYSMRNYWVGAPQYEGLLDVVPFGYSRAITFTVDNDGTATTTVDLTEIPIPKDVLQMMPLSMRRYLQGAIPASGREV